MKLTALAPWAFAIATLRAMHADAAAWTISSSPASATSAAATTADGNNNAPLAKTWTIAGDAPLQAIKVQSMGRVFVDYDASLAAENNNSAGIVAKVVVSGDVSDMLNAIEIVGDDATIISTASTGDETNVSGVKIHFQNDAFDGQGHLLTQVFVATKHALRNVTTAWSSDVVVGSDVLVENDRAATVGLALEGSGDLYAGSPSAALSFGALGVTTTGSGNVQLLAKSVDVADVVEANLEGDGRIAIVADQLTVGGTLSSLIGGPGHVFVQTNTLKAHNISSTIAGAGVVTLSREGTCDNQNVVVVGSGNVSAASIVCADAFVNLVGSSDILVQATESLTVASFFLGDVRYYGEAPKTITASSLFDYGVTHPDAKEVVQHATENDFYGEYAVKAIPERTPVFVEVKPTQE